MTAHKGSAILLKAGDGGSPEVFTTIAGFRSKEMTLRNDIQESNDVTTTPWRKLQASSGISSISISGVGVFRDSSAEGVLRSNAFSASKNNYEFIFANGNKISGAFIVSNYKRMGDIQDLENFEVTLESAGTIVFS